MSPILLNWIALGGGVLTLVFAIAFFATGKRHAILRVGMGVSLIVCVISSAMA